MKEAFAELDGELESDMYGKGELIEGFQDKMAKVLGKGAAVFFPSGRSEGNCQAMKGYITSELKARVTQIWGKAGEGWLDELPDRIEKYMELWGLSKLVVPSVASASFVGFASSPRYGDVVLKIGFPHREMYTGMDALFLYNGRLCCRLYEAERTECAMLLERIVPGKSLKEETSFLARVRIGARVAAELSLQYEEPNSADAAEHSFPVYIDQMNKAFSRARAEQRAGREFLDSLIMAEKLYDGIREQQRPQVLLHGDLHHENILLAALGQWKAIDPQGRIGEPILEAGRFFQNEWDLHSTEDAADCMEELLRAFAGELVEEVSGIAASCYIDCALSACWSLEDNEGSECIRNALIRMKWLEKFLPV